MGKGVEMRFPYLSNQLKNYVNSLSLKDKIDKNLKDKILLRKVAQKLVSKKFQTEKLPFGVPAVRKQYFSNSILGLSFSIVVFVFLYIQTTDKPLERSVDVIFWF